LKYLISALQLEAIFHAYKGGRGKNEGRRARDEGRKANEPHGRQNFAEFINECVYLYLLHLWKCNNNKRRNADAAEVNWKQTQDFQDEGEGAATRMCGICVRGNPRQTYGSPNAQCICIRNCICISFCLRVAISPTSANEICNLKNLSKQIIIKSSSVGGKWDKGKEGIFNRPNKRTIKPCVYKMEYSPEKSINTLLRRR